MVEQRPMRVLIIISDRNAYWEQSWCSSEDLLPVVFNILKGNHLLKDTYNHQPRMKLLAKQKWETRIFLVFDVSSTSYGPELGHLPEENPLPNRLNMDVARTHNNNGINSFPPFVAGYTCGPPLYLNPRDPSLLL
ncbi:hypothetical protein BDW59DRAFT_181235 [Aspergillus cavernicola]|uniref:Uncharacterized protein n=1 Tax=Aspergillus cavernicola TaxID=176166 RepID=A0ABR4I0Q2_9EURO